MTPAKADEHKLGLSREHFLLLTDARQRVQVYQCPLCSTRSRYMSMGPQRGTDFPLLLYHILAPLILPTLRMYLRGQCMRLQTRWAEQSHLMTGRALAPAPGGATG